MSRRTVLIELLERQISRLEYQIARYDEDGLPDAAGYLGLQMSLAKCRRDRDALTALAGGG